MNSRTDGNWFRRSITTGLFVVAIATLLTACGKKNTDTSASRFPAQTEVAPNGTAKIVLAGSVPEIPGSQAAVADGFIDAASWDSAQQRLNVRGWAPLDTRAATSTLIVRDPFGLVTFATPPIVKSEDRPDVAAERAKEPELLHSGFTLGLALVPDSARTPEWEFALEIYALSSSGKFARLTRGGSRPRASWERRADTFSLILVHATPSLPDVAPKKNGNLDFLTPDSAAGTVTIQGWADFDGASPQSALIIQLPPSAAPASILSYRWTPRPDVAQTVDPTRSDLARSGFEIVVSPNGAVDDLRKPGALRLWSVVKGKSPEAVGTGSVK